MSLVDYSRLIADVQRRQEWRFSVKRWQPSKGQICLDEDKDPKLGITWDSWASVKTHARGRPDPHLSFDLVWWDTTGSPDRVRSRHLYDHLRACRADLEAAIRAESRLPGTIYLNEDTARAKNRMESGFYWSGDDLKLEEPAMYQQHVAWLISVVPIARKAFLVEMNRLRAQA